MQEGTVWDFKCVWCTQKIN